METLKLGKLCKQRMKEELAARLKKDPNFFIMHHTGSSVADLEQVRRSLKDISSGYFTVKNSILDVVSKELKLEEILPLIANSVGIASGGSDVAATSKVLVTFSKGHEKFKVKGAIIDGKLLTSENVAYLASLPSKQVLLAQVVGTIQGPITGYVNVLGAILRKFVSCVDEIRKSKEGVAAS